MPTLELTYCRRRVGSALVDPELLELNFLTWSLLIPPAARAHYNRRSDLLAASLAEDPDFRSRCHPFTQLRFGGQRLQLKLAHAALRRELILPLTRHHLNLLSPEATYEELTNILSTVGRVTYLNMSRTDCRVDNLRETPLFDEGFSS